VAPDAWRCTLITALGRMRRAGAAAAIEVVAVAEAAALLPAAALGAQASLATKFEAAAECETRACAVAVELVARLVAECAAGACTVRG
jgi:hypothetical protein